MQWDERQFPSIGRSNWLFAGSLRAGKRAAAVMSLIQSARMNGHDPYAYLKVYRRHLLGNSCGCWMQTRSSGARENDAFTVFFEGVQVGSCVIPIIGLRPTWTLNGCRAYAVDFVDFVDSSEAAIVWRAAN